MSITSMFSDFKTNGGLSKEVSDKVEALFNHYKLNEVKGGNSIITAEFDKYGSLCISHIASVESEQPVLLKYESGSYDYISCKIAQDEKILWTDFKDIEPYNRQGGLYANGASFASFGAPISVTKEYREFYSKFDNRCYLSSFPVWGFSYNDFYGSVKFGICLERENVEPFINQLRSIIGK